MAIKFLEQPEKVSRYVLKVNVKHFCSVISPIKYKQSTYLKIINHPKFRESFEELFYHIISTIYTS